MSGLTLAAISGPRIDWMAISPLIALVGGACLVLMVGLLRAPFVRQSLVPLLSLVALGASAGLAIGTWGDNLSVISGAMVMDGASSSSEFCAIWFRSGTNYWRPCSDRS